MSTDALEIDDVNDLNATDWNEWIVADDDDTSWADVTDHGDTEIKNQTTQHLIPICATFNEITVEFSMNQDSKIQDMERKIFGELHKVLEFDDSDPTNPQYKRLILRLNEKGNRTLYEWEKKNTISTISPFVYDDDGNCYHAYNKGKYEKCKKLNVTVEELTPLADRKSSRNNFLHMYNYGGILSINITSSFGTKWKDVLVSPSSDLRGLAYVVSEKSEPHGWNAIDPSTIEFIYKGKRLYYCSNNKKTLAELGIEPGTNIYCTIVLRGS